jgi:phosphatidylserine/phosphatidylglycerophosphate/cardiolipin synthase-like enzyme
MKWPLTSSRYKTLPDSHDSILFDEQRFYDAFASDINSAHSSVIVESPYLTERRALQFAKLITRKVNQGIKITIYTRHPSYHTSNLESQSWIACRILKDAGARVYLCDDMRHRKIAIIDNAVLWEGSLNIFSQNESLELMRRTVCETQVRYVTKLLKLKV